MKQKKDVKLGNSPSKGHLGSNPSVSPLASMEKSSALASKNRQFLGLGQNSLQGMNNRDNYVNSNSIFSS